MEFCICGFNLADAEPNAEGRYFCPWSGHEFKESDVKKAKSTSARGSHLRATEPEPEAPAEEPEAPTEAPEPEPPAEEPGPAPEPETPGEKKGGG